MTLELDRLDRGEAVSARLVEGFAIDESRVRPPHRHDYHELIWVESGTGEHLIDGEAVPVVPGTVTVIGRGQVHQFRRGKALRGGLLRFGDEAVEGDGAGRVSAGWLLSGMCGRTISVPDGEGGRLRNLLTLISDELGAANDPYSADMERHLLSAVLLLLERWYDADRIDRPRADDADLQLLRRFVRLLERDFAAHHDAAHYADALAVPGAALAKALRSVSGFSTKELITDRVMMEARRLLRYTDLTIGEVAHRVGYDDQLYFSRAFKRHTGSAPQGYRDSLRGSAKSIR
ncbi:MAG TPA: AraC family transcriptional regulator [Thermoleophilaceae bacterium]|nr:AraC family transcriptional regulator [Thermoleophilaceae bacterium]